MNEINMQKNDKKEIFGWMMYDWANSAFFTTVIGVLLGPYLINLAQNSLCEGVDQASRQNHPCMDGVVFNLFLFDVTPKGLPAFCSAIAVVSMVFFLPILGAIADYTQLKKKMMAIFCYTGVIASSLLFFVKGDNYLICCILFIVSSISFATANVFYNAFLIEITTEDKRDKISSWGYGSGYIGGVIMLLLNLMLIKNAESLGISTELAVRISFLIASLWWGIFGFISFSLLKTRAVSREIPKGENLMTIGFSEIWVTLKELRKLKYTMIFLIAYLFYNDGIQTVILQSSVFISYELFTSKGLPEDNSFLITIFLIAQVSALIGAITFERISRYIGAKATIILSLAIWCVIVIYAYAFFENKTQAMIMGGFIGLVLGSTQALSRSLYSQMIPVGRESAFFGLYEISEKGTSWMGQLLFAIVVGATGSFRQAILALIIFFVVGTIVLLFTNINKAIHEAGQHTPEEAAHLHN
jgi:MFS transporter, UMF1 family